ncbi:protein FAM133B-like [Helianthus annuus]|uniref:protein FAM133B-like n=1 Tax=Helianthus annuus TaxID=4232 RepID=UPI000B8FF755|nr:protein FAM133B-like [Helianthus annuus]
MASSRDNLKVYLRVSEKKSISENPKSSKKPKTSTVEENNDQQGNISRKSTMKQQTSRKRKEISDNDKKQEEKQKRRRKKVVIESSEDTDSVSKDENTSRAIVLHTSEQQVNLGVQEDNGQEMMSEWYIELINVQGTNYKKKKQDEPVRGRTSLYITHKKRRKKEGINHSRSITAGKERADKADEHQIWKTRTESEIIDLGQRPSSLARKKEQD